MEFQAMLRELESRKAHFSNEIGTDLLSQLNANEQQELEKIQTESAQIRKQLDAVAKRRAKVNYRNVTSTFSRFQVLLIRGL